MFGFLGSGGETDLGGGLEVVEDFRRLRSSGGIRRYDGHYFL